MTTFLFTYSLRIFLYLQTKNIPSETTLGIWVTFIAPSLAGGHNIQKPRPKSGVFLIQ